MSNGARAFAVAADAKDLERPSIRSRLENARQECAKQPKAPPAGMHQNGRIDEPEQEMATGTGVLSWGEWETAVTVSVKSVSTGVSKVSGRE